MSLVVRLFCWVLILRPSGFLSSTLMGLGIISEPIDIIFTETAVLIGMAYILLPFMFLPIYASIEKLDHSLTCMLRRTWGPARVRRSSG